MKKNVDQKGINKFKYEIAQEMGLHKKNKKQKFNKSESK